MSTLRYSLSGYKDLAKLQLRDLNAQGIPTKLHQVQARIASEHGFRSWGAFRQAVLANQESRLQQLHPSKVDLELPHVRRPVTFDDVCSALELLEEYYEYPPPCPPEEMLERRRSVPHLIFSARATVKAYALDMQPTSVEVMVKARDEIAEFLLEQRFCILTEQHINASWFRVGPWPSETRLIDTEDAKPWMIMDLDSICRGANSWENEV